MTGLERIGLASAMPALGRGLPAQFQMKIRRLEPNAIRFRAGSVSNRRIATLALRNEGGHRD